MSRVLLAIAAFYLFFLPIASAEKIQITSVGYRAIPWSNTTFVPGQSNTACYGTGTVWGNTTDLNVNCSTVTSPDIPVTISKLFVYNQVESAEYQYLITCTRNWVGSKCTWMNVGASFDAEESGDTMNVYAYMSYNDQLKGKLTRVKFDIRNKTPKRSYQIATAQSAIQQPRTNTTPPQVESNASSIAWSQEPKSFRGVNFGMTHDEAMSKESWVSNDCPKLIAEKFCSTNHMIGSISVTSNLFFEPKLTSILVEFAPESFELMKTIFIEKYGSPHSDRYEVKKTGGSGELQDEVLMWRGSVVFVRLEKYAGNEAQKYFGKDFRSSALISTNDSAKKNIKDAADDF
jgi:hypothetical protein